MFVIHLIFLHIFRKYVYLRTEMNIINTTLQKIKMTIQRKDNTIQSSKVNYNLLYLHDVLGEKNVMLFILFCDFELHLSTLMMT